MASVSAGACIEQHILLLPSAIFLPASLLFGGVLLTIFVIGRFANVRHAAAFVCQSISAGR